MSFNLHFPLVIRGITRVIVHPVWMIVKSRSNIKWNGKTRQKVAGLTFDSVYKKKEKNEKYLIIIFQIKNKIVLLFSLANW